jgi:hypothetical protein
MYVRMPCLHVQYRSVLATAQTKYKAVFYSLSRQIHQADPSAWMLQCIARYSEFLYRSVRQRRKSDHANTHTRTHVNTYTHTQGLLWIKNRMAFPVFKLPCTLDGSPSIGRCCIFVRGYPRSLHITTSASYVYPRPYAPYRQCCMPT